MSHGRRLIVAVAALIVGSCDAFVATGAMRAPATMRLAAAQHASMSLVRKVRSRPHTHFYLSLQYARPLTSCQNAVTFASQVNTQEFEEEIQDCSTPIVVDIFAVWCGPVRRSLSTGPRRLCSNTMLSGP